MDGSPLTAAVVADIVITGIGMVTPLGRDARVVLQRILAGESAAAPTGFKAGVFACPVCAPVRDFGPADCPAEPKLVRLMSRDAQLAVTAARLAVQDAALAVGTDYAAEDVALFGAVGTAGLPLKDALPLVRAAATEGGFDPERFGRDALRAVNPLLSFKILGNMPVCFISIREGIAGPNAVYTPWEGQGLHAIAAAIRALRSGDANCAVVGGCDVKTHELAFISLEQHGHFAAWTSGAGPVPGEGAAFLVLETARRAAARGARVYARIDEVALRTKTSVQTREATAPSLWRALGVIPGEVKTVVAAVDGDPRADVGELAALSDAGVSAARVISPKRHVGDLFAGAAPLQVAIGALAAHDASGRVLVHSIGRGSECGAVVLSSP